ncbi:hypothetical protein K0B03_02375 [Patescibacteria group bacterium]|nr:hypothetical protein [Patescibacteria group bacterium]
MIFLERKFELYLYFCVTMFFFLLGIILFYSFGYKYNITDKKTIQTGAIIIKSDPENINILKNNQPFINNITLTNLFSDFIKIEELESATYNIKAVKDEYFQWEKNVEVKSGYVTELKNIVLLKNNYSKNILLKEIKNNPNADNIFVSNNKDKIIYARKLDELTNLFIYDINNGSETEISSYNKFMRGKFTKEYSIENVIWSKNDSKIIIQTKNEQAIESYLIDFQNNFQLYDVNFIFKDDNTIENNWNFAFDNEIFFIKDGTLFEYNFKNKTSLKILDNISSFMLENGYIYYIKQNDNVLYYQYLSNVANEKKIVILEENNTSNLIYKIIKSKINTYLILSSSEILYYIDERNNIHTINNSVKNASFTNNQKRILYNNDHEIWIYYIEEKISQPAKKKATNELVTRFSGQIDNISMYKDEEHIFYKEGSVYKFLEIDKRDKKNVFKLMSLSNNNIFYLQNLNSLYYLENDQFIQIDLNEK